MNEVNEMSMESWESLKSMLMDWHRGMEKSEKISCGASVSQDSFIIRNSDSVVWGRVFDGPLYPELLSHLRREIDAFRAQYHQRVVVYLFFPELPQDMPRTLREEISSDEGNQHSCWIRFMEYQMLEGRAAPAMALRESSSVDLRRSLSPECQRRLWPWGAKKTDAGYLTNLTKSEIGDLTDLFLNIRQFSHG